MSIKKPANVKYIVVIRTKVKSFEAFVFQNWIVKDQIYEMSPMNESECNNKLNAFYTITLYFKL